MQSVIVIVGVIGSGKTTLAKELARAGGGQYLSFDAIWHGECQSNGYSPIDAACWIRSQCAEFTVIDGWWTWELEWWKIKNDITLSFLSNVRLIHLQPTMEEAIEGHRAKLAQYEESGEGLKNEEAYRESLPARMDYLSRKVREWGR